MIRHVVIFQWRPDANPAEVQAAEQALLALKSRIPGVAALSCGKGLGLVSGKFGAQIGVQSQRGDFALVLDFASLEDWHTYNEHPEHRKVVYDSLRPVIASRVSAQFEV